MGLFSKKPPCPICGGKIGWFLPSKIEGEYVCSNCHDKLDMEQDKESQLTMRGFKEYLTFYEQNRLLKDRFAVSEHIDFGLWNTQIILDYQHKLFCLSNKPDKTVFEGKQLKAFTIKEDRTPLLEGSAAGICRYASTVPERALAMGAQIAQIASNQRMNRALDVLDDGKVNRSTRDPYFDIPEPFKEFKVELHFDHPYWTVFKFEIDGPRFNNDRPDLNDYIRSYERSIKDLEKLAAALKTVAFPEAAEQSGGAGVQAGPISSASPADAIEEIKKYKALMEEGIISQQEFEAKKKQLLGI